MTTCFLNTRSRLAFQSLAVLATREGRHQGALRLAAGSERLDEGAGATRTAGFAGLLEGDPAAEARAGLADDEEADRALQEGRAMTLDQAVAVARGDEA